MAALIAFAATGMFAAGAAAAMIGVVSVAIRREEEDLTLAGEAPGHGTRARRWLDGCMFAPRAPPPLTR